MDDGNAENSVTIQRAVGGWEVKIVEHDQWEVRSFPTQHLANNFAVTSMVRLNLDHIRENFSEPEWSVVRTV